jgi:putative methyltransferase (TIGR04325 family)
LGYLTLGRAHRFLDGVAGWPVLGVYLRKKYERMFAANLDANLFRGVFATFEEAERSAPRTRPLGYDHPGPAAMYLERTRKVYPTDYPVLFWLQKLFREGQTRVFDLGGHTGVSYYSYRRYLDYPATLRWQVHDVPAVVQQGRHLAAEMDRGGHLSFADRFDEAEGADILFALGSLQYLPETLAERVGNLKNPPRHLMLNLIPLHERLSYFTLQSIGTAFCPYRITALSEFQSAYERLGYEVVDSWENPEKRCEIPFHPEHSLNRYCGLYMRRRVN